MSAPSTPAINLPDTPISLTILGIAAIIVAGEVYNVGYLKMIFSVGLLIVSIMIVYGILYLALNSGR